MATIQQLIERIETRLFLLSGLDVQIHAEGQIEEMLRGVYNSLFDDFWYPDHTLFRTETLNGTTGEVIGDLTDIARRYKDIAVVFHEDSDEPLPRVTPGASLTNIRRMSVMPSGDPKTVFKIVPFDTTGMVSFWYRTRISDDVWANQEYDAEINMDDDVLMYGVVYEFLVNDDSNATATAEYKSKFAGRQKQLRDAQWEIPLSKKELEHDGPLTRWR